MTRSKIELIFSLSLVVLFLYSCSDREPRYPVSVSSGVDYKGSIELAKKINQKEEIHFREYLENHDEKFERSHYGFLYYISNNVDSLIKSGDKVKYTFIVESLEGKVIYPMEEKILSVDHQEEIKGMHEGLKLMSQGASATFIFPSHQAYGFHGDEKKIVSNTPLVYKVEVQEVVKKEVESTGEESEVRDIFEREFQVKEWNRKGLKREVQPNKTDSLEESVNEIELNKEADTIQVPKEVSNKGEELKEVPVKEEEVKEVPVKKEE
ncbi:MAG: FKBP-type peptidyl-prolyl cis-trans isomerase, partial [Bacteroidota bacterium]